jgi:hypothetical protein
MATVSHQKLLDAVIAYDRAMLGRVPNSAAKIEAMLAALEAANAPAPVVKRCQAERQGDEMACGRCGLRWSPGDEDPPSCSPVERRVTIRREADQP